MSDTSLILWAQQYASPVLTGFFTAVTSFGSAEFYMLIIPVIYWSVNKQFGFRLAVFISFSSYINSGFKHLFAAERPPGELRLVTQEGFSFPSGHAQGATAFWGFLALKLDQNLYYWLAGLIVFLISFSRIYLGVHWPIDILGGLAVGLALLFLYKILARIKLKQISFKTWMFGSAALILILCLLQPTRSEPVAAGFLLGILIGRRLELIHVKFNEEASLSQNIIKSSLGLSILFLLRIVLKPLVGWMPGGLAVVIRYGLVGLWASLGAPYIFTKLNLCKKPVRPWAL